MNTPPLLHRTGNGFTLVEVLVAAAILAIGLMATATMISRSTIQDARSYYMTQASLMVEEFLENQTLNQYDRNLFANMTGANATRTIDGVQYTMNCTLNDDTPIENCKEMNCSVVWNNKGLQSRTTSTYVFSKKY